MHNLRLSIKSNIKKALLGIMGLAVGVGMLGYFYQYSQKSRATTINIPFEFSQQSLNFSPEDFSKDVDILIMGAKKVSGATALLSYPKDIVKFGGIKATETCNGLDTTIRTLVDEDIGQIALTKISRSTDNTALPPSANQAFFCFARLTFLGKSTITTQTGEITFITGSVGESRWEVVGPDGTYTPSYADQKVSVTVSDGTYPTASPTPSPTSPDHTLTPNPSITATPTVTPSPDLTTTATPTPTPITSPTQTPTPSSENPDMKINFRVKLQGITRQPKTTRSADFKVIIVQSGSIISEKTFPFTPQADGTWVADAEYPNLSEGGDYSILIKGPKHLQKKICENNPTESIGGFYHCSTGKIILKKGDNTLDFSNILLLAGDIPIQNGLVDAVDIAYIRNNSGSQDPDILAHGDLNYDEIVDSQDYAMVISAISFKYDEGE